MGSFSDTRWRGEGGLFLLDPEWTLQDSCVPPRDLPAVSAWKNLWGRRFKYFLQVYECAKETRAKVKVKKWIDMPEPKRYDEFVCTWHYFLKDLERDGRKRHSGTGGEDRESLSH